MTAATDRGTRIAGRHVLFALLAFFGVMFLVNAIFVYFAISTFNGVETGDAYRQGLAYNSRIADEDAVRSRGWRGKMNLEPSGNLTLSLTDKYGSAVPGLFVRAKLGRPATDKFDQAMTLQEVAPGNYQAPAGPLAKGNWVVAIEAEQERSTGRFIAYRMKERIWLSPSK